MSAKNPSNQKYLDREAKGSLYRKLLFLLFFDLVHMENLK